MVRNTKVVCLCGSCRFYETWLKVAFEMSLQGIITVGVAFWPGAREHGQMAGITPEQKIELDELHKRRIDVADEVFVLNVGGYIGDSTKSEIKYAREHGKPVRWLEIPNVEE